MIMLPETRVSLLFQVMGDGSEAAGSGKFTSDLMDQFFRDPNMQQLLYKYLPEPMRNPQTFEWMLSNPEYRKQLEGMMEQQVCWLPCTLSQGHAYF